MLEQKNKYNFGRSGTEAELIALRRYAREWYKAQIQFFSATREIYDVVRKTPYPRRKATFAGLILSGRVFLARYSSMRPHLEPEEIARADRDTLRRYIRRCELIRQIAKDEAVMLLERYPHLGRIPVERFKSEARSVREICYALDDLESYQPPWNMRQSYTEYLQWGA